MLSRCSQLLCEVKQDKHPHFRGREGGEVSPRMAEGDTGYEESQLLLVLVLGSSSWIRPWKREKKGELHPWGTDVKGADPGVGGGVGPSILGSGPGQHPHVLHHPRVNQVSWVLLDRWALLDPW